MLLALLLCVITPTHATPRAVVTFASAALNTPAITPTPENVTEVKRYGRRLVVHLGRDMVAADSEWLGAQFHGSALSVEPDTLVSIDGGDEASPLEIVEFDNVPYSVNEPGVTQAPPREDDRTTADTEESTTDDEPQTTEEDATPWNLDDSEPYGLHIQQLRKTTAGNATVAILDSGLAAAGVNEWRPAGGFDFISSPDYSNDQTGRDINYTDPGDSGPGCPSPSWHGTRVASVVYQIAPAAELVILRVLGRCGTGFANDVTDAIVWAAGGVINGVEINTHPARIISMSFAGEGPCPSYLQSAVNTAVSAGAVLVAAAGNQGKDAAGYFPGNCAGVLSIGASTRDGRIAPYSNFGPTVDWYAPGGDSKNPILTTTAMNQVLVPYQSTGTSFAVPHISGLFALISNSSQITHSENENYLQCSAPHNNSIAFFNCEIQLIANQSENRQVIAQGATCPSNMVDGVTKCSCAAGSGANLQYAYTAPSNDGGTAYDLRCTPPNWVCKVSHRNELSVAYTFQLGFACCNLNRIETEYFYLNSDALIGIGTYGSTSLMPLSSRVDFDTISPIAHVKWSYAGATFKDYAYNVIRSFGDGGDASMTANGNGWSYETDCGVDDVVTGFAGWFGWDIDCVIPICNKLCAPCPAGQSSTPGNPCANCLAGTYSSAPGGLCQSCSAGSYSADRATVCIVCQAGFYNPTVTSACIPCPAGKCCTAASLTAPNMGSGTNVPCPITKYCPLQCADPTICPAGSQCNTGSSAPADCSAGTYCNQGTGAAGTDCTMGNYCPVRSPAPVPCPEGTFSTTKKLSAVSECGSCGTGKYNPQTGQTICQDCPSGTYMSGTGATGCKVCTWGTYNSDTGKSRCNACEAGKYAYYTAMSACDSCPSGTSSTATGAASATVCTTCAAGSYSTTPASQWCTSCDKGTYGSIIGKTTKAAACTDCNAGYEAPREGMTACTPCPAGKYAATRGTRDCASCINQYSLGGASQCTSCNATPCNEGSFRPPCPPDSDPPCTSCPVIAHCTYPTSTCDIGGVPTCTCDDGFELVGGACVPCADGFFKNKAYPECRAVGNPICDAGYFKVPGNPTNQASCVPCPTLPPNTVFDAVSGAPCAWQCGPGFEGSV